MKFWDASAIVPLLVDEPSSDAFSRLHERDPDMIVWWSAAVECVSAISRREREGALTVSDASAALERLREIASQWHEVQPLDAIRATAQRLLRVHPLRAADSLQLAAAILASEHEPATLDFVSLDEPLVEAASREGFRIVRA